MHRLLRWRTALRIAGASAATSLLYPGLALTSAASAPLDGAAPPPPPARAASPLVDTIARVVPALVKVEGHVRVRGGGLARVASGSGFVVSGDGLVVTNAHVLASAAAAGARELRAVFDDGRVYRLAPLAADAESDLALARILAPPGSATFAALPLAGAAAAAAAARGATSPSSSASSSMSAPPSPPESAACQAGAAAAAAAAAAPPRGTYLTAAPGANAGLLQLTATADAL
jgi:S1-C subfamily serine protease